MVTGFSLPIVAPLGPEIFLAIIGCAVILADIIWKEQRYVVPIVALAGSVATVLMVAKAHGLSFNGMYTADGFGAFFKVVCLLGLILAILMSLRHLEIMNVRKVGEFFSLMIFSCVGMMIMASATDLMVLYLGLELMALSVYCLVGLLKTDPRASEAATKYLLLGAFASCLLLFGLSYLYGTTGTTDMRAIADAMAKKGLTNNSAFMMGLGLVVIAFCFKVAAAPFHMWTPDAYEGAMTPVTAFMSVGPKAAGFAALGRVLMQAFPSAHSEWMTALIIMAFLTMAIGNITALCQTSIKRMLAYSSIAHAGYALIGFLPGTPEGVSATMNYLFIYLFMNMGAFAVIILLQYKGLVGEALDDYKGLAKSHPLAAGLMLVFMFSLTGIPPTAGFIGKFNLFLAALHAGYTWIVIFAVLFSAISAYFYLRV
ncbi:MAG: NADH-quinone oxidoreductase subunit N, partial [Thermodesulfobacteria bacterium]|nr:NADH-quinone oxidoreductase subunit N [Thermodesulfobacteriota bacterium]